MYQEHFQSQRLPFRDLIKVLEADIQHANNLCLQYTARCNAIGKLYQYSKLRHVLVLQKLHLLLWFHFFYSAAALPRDYRGDSVQMKLSYSPFAPLVFFLIEWIDYTYADTLASSLGLLHIVVYKVYIDGIPALSSEDRKASLREFYAVIYPTLKQLKTDLTEQAQRDNSESRCCASLRTSEEYKQLFPFKGLERDDECGICMETYPKLVLPNCGHSMCISCFRDWNSRSHSCPFCRGNLQRVCSGDLWILTSESDVMDMISLAKENLICFYRYIENLPFVLFDSHTLLYEYLI